MHVRLLPVMTLLFSIACHDARKAEAAQPAAAPSAPASVEEPRQTPPASPAPRVDAQRAFRYVREFVAIGSRKPGSPGHQKAEQYILGRLKQAGIESEVDAFDASTPAGPFSGKNIIGKIPGSRDGIVVLVGHYETNYWLPNNFVGANDGGSNTGLMLELAALLQPKSGKRDGYSVWLVWDDCEEAFKEWSPTDSLYGTRHLAQKWQQDGTLKKIKALFVLDMIGDRDLNIQRDQNSTPWLLDLVHQAASGLGYQSHFFRTETAVEDDHLPFQRLGVPVADIIDIDYGYGNAFHHTLEDTLDKLSPKSLQIVGDTMLQAIWMLDRK